MRYLLISLALLCTGICTQAQTLTGVVMEADGKGKFMPLPSATVYWLGTSHAAQTDSNGIFHINADSSTNRLVITFVGYEPDTLTITDFNPVKVILSTGKVLREITVEERQAGSFYSSMQPIKTQMINEKELFKAACCNLSESFETNPSVDVAPTDAVTGIKQIQMLGLSGVYTQVTTENMAATRGLAAHYGLNFIPGTWIEGIQINKGMGSVANGYESITGQINTELKKPETAERLYLNIYQSTMGRSEGNLVLSQRVSPKWSTALLLHGSGTWRKNDGNEDSFLDIPLGYQANVLNRWKYDNGKGFMMQFGVRVLADEKQSGQLDFDPSRDKGDTVLYGVGLNTRRLEGWTKVGYVFAGKQYESIGLQVNAIHHKQDNYYGLTTYTGEQNSGAANLIYQSIIGNTAHKYRAGLSLMYDDYAEHFQSQPFYRTERSAGAFAEYTYSALGKFDMVLGLRADYHNLFGWIITPRAHMRYSINEKTIVRAVFGRGQRMANIFAENAGWIISSRQVVLPGNASAGKPYGLAPEVAWNTGANLTREFRIGKRKGSAHLDYYYTWFTQQTVVDLENIHQIRFSNLDGKASYSHSLQAEIDYEPLRRLDIRLAYRWLDVKTTYQDGLKERPLIAAHRAFANIAYETRGKWKFDYTVSWNGTKRVPGTDMLPMDMQMPSQSPDYWQMNAQVTKTFGRQLDVYIGMENITDFRQMHLVVSPEQPFGPHFDASLVWGPVIGRMAYTGLRWKIK